MRTPGQKPSEIAFARLKRVVHDMAAMGSREMLYGLTRAEEVREAQLEREYSEANEDWLTALAAEAKGQSGTGA